MPPFKKIPCLLYLVACLLVFYEEVLCDDDDRCHHDSGGDVGGLHCEDETISDIDVIRQSLVEWNYTLTLSYGALQTAYWLWETNLNDDNTVLLEIESAKNAEILKEIWKKIACIDCSQAGCNDEERRRLNSYRNIGTAALPQNLFADEMYLETTMTDIYSTATVCLPNQNEQNNNCLALEPDLTNVFTHSRDHCTLKWAWQAWRNETGRKIRGFFTAYVFLQNAAAKLNGFKSSKEMWTSGFLQDDGTFFEQIEEAWSDLKSFYEQLHFYVRRKLMETYGDDKFPPTGHIPAHLLGNMWAQDWSAIYNIVQPYPEAPSIDLTALLEGNKTSVMSMVRMADNFFQSLGMQPMTDDFWQNSVFHKRKEGNMNCHASAFDFFEFNDFRIKMCSQVNEENFRIIHHEMGHIQYYMHYQNQPVEFRDAANPGFHEAIGDLVALSAVSPSHLATIGLIPEIVASTKRDYYESLINSQMLMALEKIANLPFTYLVDKYRWAVFDKTIPFSHLNTEWWKLRCHLQGVSPPVVRTEEDFDAGAKFHVAANSPYIMYFYSLVVQFQFHRAICRRMGFTKDFHKCDIYGNQEAASVLRQALQLGSSRPYPDVLQLITGGPRLDASSVVDYFMPLYKWLRKQNKGYNVTWQSDCPSYDQIPQDDACDYDEIDLEAN